jgi:bacillithiol system protein YtxJ
MSEQFVTVGDAGELEQLFARSQREPVLLFKHSTTCPISAAAYEQMRRVEREVALVVVQRARDLSREIEARTGVRHESPQALILRDGKAVWSASHWSVTSDAVARALGEHGGRGAERQESGAGGRGSE